MSAQIETKKTRFRSLSVTLAITFLALTLVVLLIASSLQIYFSFQAQREIIVSKQDFIAKDAANAVKSFIEEKFGILEKAVVFSNLAVASQEEQELTFGRLLGEESSFRQLVLLNAGGEELARVSRLSKPLSEKLMKYSKSEVFSKTRQKETYISPLYIDEITSEPMLVMAVPVTDIFGVFQGILMAEVNLKFTWDLVTGIKIGEKGLAYVVDKDGNLIAFGDISRVLKKENLIHLDEVNEFVKGDELIPKPSADISRGILGSMVVANHARLEEPDWAVIVELPVTETYGTVIRGMVLSAVVIVLCTTLAIIVGISLSKRITRPIQQLTAVAQVIAGGDLAKRAKISSRDEVGQLAASFNKMVENLEKERAFTENIVNTMPVSLVVINSDGKIGLVNKTTCELLEYTEEELVGQPIERVFNHAIRGVILKGGGSEGLIKGVTIKDKQLIFRTKKDQEIPLAISESVVKDKEGKLKYIVMVAQDLREILKLEEEKRKAEVAAVEKEIKSLKELDKLKDEFLNIAAHELKTPLTSIVSLSEMLKEQKPFFDSQYQKYINIIHEEGDRLTHIVKRILTVTRYESARETVYSEPFNLISFVSSLQPNLNLLVEKKKSRIIIKSEKKDIVIESDKEKISQVIYNFVDNAVKYGPEGQTITIAISKPEKDWVKIKVKDQGPGIPPALQKRLFIKFSQLEPSLSRSQEGTGLGLYICKLIIDKLGGKIGVKSVLGEGSTFYFNLPIIIPTKIR